MGNSFIKSYKNDAESFSDSQEKNNRFVKVEDLLKNVDKSILNSQDVESESESLEFEEDLNDKLLKLINKMMTEMDLSDLKEINLN